MLLSSSSIILNSRKKATVDLRVQNSMMVVKMNQPCYNMVSGKNFLQERRQQRTIRKRPMES